MSVAIPDFWTLAVQSGLWSPQQCQQLAAQYGQTNGAAADGPAEPLVEWLVAARAMSPYQAMVLLAGHPGPFLFGDYIVYDRAEEPRLAGMFRAVHAPTNHPVCLHFLTGPAAQDPQRFAALSQWCVQTAQVRSPHVARAYHVVDTGAYKFVVLEDLHGETLEQKLAAGPIAAATACGWARHAALGLAQMQQLGQLHGELRPANLWIDATGYAKLLYFPLWRDPLTGPTVLATGGDRLAVAADYMAPEVAAGRSPEPRSDIYSLGCLLYHMLAGRPPFDGAGVEQKLARQLSDAPRPADHVQPSVPAPIAQVAGYLLEKDPGRRYQHAANVAQALQPYAEPAMVNPVPEYLTAASQAYEAWLQQSHGWGSAASAPPISSGPAPPIAPPVAARGVAAPPAAPALGRAVAQAVPVAAQATPAVAVPVAAPAAVAVAMTRPAQGVAMAAPASGASRAAAPQREMPSLALSPAAAPKSSSSGGSSLASRKKKQQLATIGSIVGAVAVIGMVIFALSRSSTPRSKPGATEIVDGNGDEKSRTALAKTEEKSGESGGQPKATATLAESITPVRGNEFLDAPISGPRPPLDLAYMPNGVQIFIALRPAAIMAHPQGQYILSVHDLEAAGKVTVLGPLSEFAKSEVTRLCGGLPWEELEQVVIGIIPKPGGPPQTAVVARSRKPVALDALTKAAGLDYRSPGGAANILVATPGKTAAETAAEEKEGAAKPAAMIDEAMGNDKGPVLSPAAMEALQRVSDNERMFTVLFAPGFAFSGDDCPIWKGVLEGFKEPVSAFLGNASRLQAGLFSVHLAGETVCLELRVQPNAELGPIELAAELDKRISDLPDVVEKSVLSMETVKYVRPILFKLPGMVKEIAVRTDVGSSGRHAVARCYLPAHALSSLSYGAYLAAAQTNGGGAGGTVAVGKPKVEDEPKTALEKLARKKTSVTDNDEFQRVVKTLSDELRVPIEIIGIDLQMDGITRNKRVAVDLKDMPVGEILRKIFLMVDPEGKLVYFVKDDRGTEKIFISTRKKTAERKDPVPPEFGAAPKVEPKKKP